MHERLTNSKIMCTSRCNKQIISCRRRPPTGERIISIEQKAQHDESEYIYSGSTN
jgi:hypothetical protein